MATLILKATEKCNSNCYYCDVVKKKTGESMTPAILEKVFYRVGEYLDEDQTRRVELIWHGGEPLLLGPDFYRTALKCQNSYCTDPKKINHSMQTNITCLTEEFIPVLRDLGITSIGTSFDPEPHIRGAGDNHDSVSYNRQFFRGLTILKKHGIGWGIIYVVTKKSLGRPLDVFFYLSNLMPGGGFNMNPVLIYDEERKDISITPEEYVSFLGAIFPAWWKHRKRYPDVQPFKSLVETIIDGKVSLGCVESGMCTYQHINVSPDGETSQCGRSSDWGILSYGNIADKSIRDILRNDQRDQLAKRLEVLPGTDCNGCRFWSICHGGCPLDAYSLHKDFMHKSEWCDSKKLFIENYFEPVTGVKYHARSA